MSEGGPGAPRPTKRGRLPLAVTAAIVLVAGAMAAAILVQHSGGQLHVIQSAFGGLAIVSLVSVALSFLGLRSGSRVWTGLAVAIGLAAIAALVYAIVLLSLAGSFQMQIQG